MVRPISEQEQLLLSAVHQLPRPQDLPDLQEGEPLAREWKTYKREIVRLLAEGHVGRFALIKDDAVVSIWDTHRDGRQAGHERFGLDLFMVQEIQAVERVYKSGYNRLCPN